MGKIKFRIRSCVNNCKSPKLAVAINTWKVKSNMTVMNGAGTQYEVFRTAFAGMISKYFRSLYEEILTWMKWIGISWSTVPNSGLQN